MVDGKIDRIHCLSESALHNLSISFCSAGADTEWLRAWQLSLDKSLQIEINLPMMLSILL